MADHVDDRFDMGADGGAKAPPFVLKNLHSTIAEMVEIETFIAQAEDDLKAAKKALQNIKTAKLPDIMAELQMDDCTHAGWNVKLSDFVSGSIPKGENERRAAFEWLKDHEAGGLIKTDIKLSFGREGHNEALALAQDLIKAGHTVDFGETVHPQTLQSFARERIRDGDEIDTDVLGLYVGKVVKAKEVKK